METEYRIWNTDDAIALLDEMIKQCNSITAAADEPGADYATGNEAYFLPRLRALRQALEESVFFWEGGGCE